MKTLLGILCFVLLSLPTKISAAQDTITTPPVPAPVLVWQDPLPISLLGTSIAVGASPMVFEAARRQNILVREKVQMWRRERMGHRQLHFDNVLQFMPLASVVALDLAGVPARHEGWPLMQRVATTAAVNVAITYTLKHIVGEWRPDRSSTTSFPSGHTAFAFSSAELMRLEYGDTSPWIPAAGFVVAAFTGFMRIYNDRHWTGDVIAGAGIGIISADLTFWLNEIIDRKLWKR